VRGQDNIDDENANGSTTDIRASVHGDVLHSRPAVINYNRLKTLITGTDTDSQLMRDSDIYVFYGTNGGMLHAVKGGVLQKPNGSGGTTALTVGVGPTPTSCPAPSVGASSRASSSPTSSACARSRPTSAAPSRRTTSSTARSAST
jgi:hypothetical protein